MFLIRVSPWYVINYVFFLFFHLFTLLGNQSKKEKNIIDRDTGELYYK